MRRMMPILIAIPLLLLATAGGAFIAMQFLAPGAASAGEPKPAEPKKNDHSALGPTLVLPERVLNLADTGTGRYLKIAAAIEFKPEKDDWYKASDEERKKKEDEFRKTMASRAAVMQDVFIMHISSKRSAELMTSEGKERLKIELLQRLKAVVKEPEVVNIYFTEFVMQ
ncbi:MAG: flagellar protein FliL [Dehalococcoidia bacterium]|nr:MAG: flagellar protein FliL [Dehalococcoidia bacterium]